MPKAVRFQQYGGIEVLRVVEVDRPVPGPGQVLVRVVVAAINPGEVHIRTGALHDRWPATFPSGEGSDLAGIVEETGAGVEGFAIGDEVIGFTDNRASHAEFVVVEAADLIPRPHGRPVGTGRNAVRGRNHGVRGGPGRRGGTGRHGRDLRRRRGVGSIAVQLARHTGATVIGLASEANHEWLAAHGAIPVTYGEGVADRIRAAADGGKIDAFIDTFGADYVEMALDLGVVPERIDTITDHRATEKYGVKTDGNSAAGNAQVIAELAALIGAGRLEIPIAATYPLEEVRDAFRELERGHTRGKIVLRP